MILKNSLLCIYRRNPVSSRIEGSPLDSLNERLGVMNLRAIEWHPRFGDLWKVGFSPREAAFAFLYWMLSFVWGAYFGILVFDRDNRVCHRSMVIKGNPRRFFFSLSDAEITQVETVQDWRRRSIAKEVLLALNGLLATNKIYWICRSENVGSRALAENCGYTLLGTAKAVRLFGINISIGREIQAKLDRDTERTRYDARASDIASHEGDGYHTGVFAYPISLRSPYFAYESLVQERIRPGQCVLELCSGTGTHTMCLLETGACVVVTDISANSLALVKQKYQATSSLMNVLAADIEGLPFGDSSFDVITIAGGMSYGEPENIIREVRRVLKAGGIFICVDSLNDNPIYRLNRWVHYLNGRRSKSTLIRMPSYAYLGTLGKYFSVVDVRYFGAISFLAPIIGWVVGEEKFKIFSDWVDAKLVTKRSAFKFVMVATK